MSNFAGTVTLEVDRVSKRFAGPRGAAALDSVSLRLDEGCAIGIVGESGSGKSTLARLMVGLETPTSGSIRCNGRDLSWFSAGEWREFRSGVQLVGQDTTTSFDPRHTMRTALRAPIMRLRGMSKRQADARIDEVLEVVGLPAAMANRRPSQLSGGQRQRFSFARALVVEPRLLICDEVVSALDVSVQGTVLNLLKRYCTDHGAGLVFVSHGLPATAFVSTELVVMHRGRIVEQGPTRVLVEAAAHPYSAQLLAAHRGDGPVDIIDVDLDARATWSCRYAAECGRAGEVCRTHDPLLEQVGDRLVACHDPIAVDDDSRSVLVGGAHA